MKFNPQPKSGMSPKKTPKPIKRTRIKYKPKNTGQVDVFETIASERDWKCFVTDKYLTVLTATQFLHVLPKALNKYPKYKTYAKNIVLATDEVHHLWDHTSREDLKKDKRFDKLFELEAELKAQYPNII